MNLWTTLLGRESHEDRSLNLDDWYEQFKYAANNYLLLGNGIGQSEGVDSSFVGYVQGAYKSNGVVFAAMLARLMIFSEARFQYQELNGGRPGKLYGDQSLAILEQPWVNGTTGDLLARMIQDVDLSGNFYAARVSRTRVRRIRPDWVEIVLTGDPNTEADVEVAGYVEWPGGRASKTDPIVHLPEEIVHWAPIPDPVAMYRGMSWLTPVLREIESDKLATRHKVKFFENGATLQTVISLKETVGEKQFKKFAEVFHQTHAGVDNAYKNLVVGGGADVTLVGADMRQIDFKATQGAGETRIASASGMHPVLLGLSEGLSGSSLNQGNFSAARRLTADKTFRPLWRTAAGALSKLVPVRNGSRLWFDDRDIAFLREDLKDLAEIQKSEAETIRTLIDGGWEPESVKNAVTSQDWSLLKHTGLLSVQLQVPGQPKPGQTPPPNGDQ